jgi:hypothetical protein
MKKSIRTGLVISLVLVGIYSVISYFPKEKIKVNFYGIEGFYSQVKIENETVYECTAQTSNVTENGDKIELKCRNRLIGLLTDKIIVEVTGLMKIEVLDSDKFEFQLIKANNDFTKPDYLYSKVNKDVNNINDLGVSYYVFYNNGTDSKYYMIDNLFNNDGVYTQVTFDVNGSFRINPKMTGDVVNHANSNNFPELIKKIESLGYQKVMN